MHNYICNDEDDASKKYGNLVEANSEAASQLIPVKKRRKKNDTSKDHKEFYN